VDKAFAAGNAEALTVLSRRTDAPLPWIPAAVARWLREGPTPPPVWDGLKVSPWRRSVPENRGIMQTAMNIRIATTDTEIAACFPVMLELRPHLVHEQFVARIRSQEPAGYRLAYVRASDSVVAVAGFRLAENLAWGRFLYVDDLVTLPDQRSKGHGAKLLSWLKKQAAREGCGQMHLDSGIQRKEAHRFYERAGMTMTSLHFVDQVAPGNAPQTPPESEMPEP